MKKKITSVLKKELRKPEESRALFMDMSDPKNPKQVLPISLEEYTARTKKCLSGRFLVLTSDRPSGFFRPLGSETVCETSLSQIDLPKDLSENRASSVPPSQQASSIATIALKMLPQQNVDSLSPEKALSKSSPEKAEEEPTEKRQLRPRLKRAAPTSMENLETSENRTEKKSITKVQLSKEKRNRFNTIIQAFKAVTKSRMDKRASLPIKFFDTTNNKQQVIPVKASEFYKATNKRPGGKYLSLNAPNPSGIFSADKKAFYRKALSLIEIEGNVDQFLSSLAKANNCEKTIKAFKRVTEFPIEKRSSLSIKFFDTTTDNQQVIPVEKSEFLRAKGTRASGNHLSFTSPNPMGTFRNGENEFYERPLSSIRVEGDVDQFLSS